jgi:hypothetical protein
LAGAVKMNKFKLLGFSLHLCASQAMISYIRVFLGAFNTTLISLLGLMH